MPGELKSPHLEAWSGGTSTLQAWLPARLKSPPLQAQVWGGSRWADLVVYNISVYRVCKRKCQNVKMSLHFADNRCPSSMYRSHKSIRGLNLPYSIDYTSMVTSVFSVFCPFSPWKMMDDVYNVRLSQFNVPFACLCPTTLNWENKYQKMQLHLAALEIHSQM